jgi:hypothetical protein
MAKYKLTETAYIGNVLYHAGDKVVVGDDVIPGPHMIPVDKAAKAVTDRIPGFTNAPMPDPIDQLTSMGASPKAVKSGILASDDEIPL